MWGLVTRGALDAGARKVHQNDDLPIGTAAHGPRALFERRTLRTSSEARAGSGSTGFSMP